MTHTTPELVVRIAPQAAWFWTDLYEDTGVDWSLVDPWGKEPSEVCVPFLLTEGTRDANIATVRRVLDFLRRHRASHTLELRDRGTPSRLILEDEFERLVQVLRPDPRVPDAVPRSTRHDGELPLLSAVVNSMHEPAGRAAYADWLASRGDVTRAGFLRAIQRAIATGAEGDLPEPLEGHDEWSWLMGGDLVRALLDSGWVDHRHEILRLVRPALTVREASPLVHDSELAIGRSKLWGHPDLPSGASWPRHRDCSAHAMGEQLLLDEHCGFVGQIRLEDVSQTVCRGILPESGLLSIFAFCDLEETEVVGIALSLQRGVSDLRRVPPPGRLLELNEVRAPIAVQFQEALRLPELDGPHGTALRDRGIDLRAYDELRKRGYRGRARELLGYGTATTGGDPTQSCDWRQLAWLESPGGMGLHLQILESDLRNATLEATSLAWVDFD